MKPVLADTSYYIALLSENDAAHDAAVTWTDSLLGGTVVTEYVLIELGNALSRSRQRDRYAPFVEEVLSDPDTLFVPASLRLFRREATGPPRSASGTWVAKDTYPRIEALGRILRVPLQVRRLRISARSNCPVSHLSLIHI